MTIYLGTGRMSKLIVDADLAMGLYNITLGAGQTVDGKDISADLMDKSVFDTDGDDAVNKFETLKSVAGANLRDSIDANTILDDAVYTLKKAMIIPKKYTGGVFTVKFSLDNEFDAHTTYGKLYKNGEAHGTERTRGTGILGMLEFSENLHFVGGDRVEFWGKSTNRGHMENFRIYSGSDVAGDSDTWIDG